MDALSRIPPRFWRVLAALLAASCTAVAADASDFVTVHARTSTQTVRAYGQVEPISLIQVRTALPGTLGQFRVVPGSVVAAGAMLAEIRGPQMQALLTARKAGLRSAQAREAAATRTLEAVRRSLAAQLATGQEADAARSELAAARAAVQTADAQLRETRSQQTLRAPAAGTVMSVQTAEGEQIRAGDTLLTLQPAGRLWIRAAFYGADAALLHAGMAGRFQPANAGEAIAVKVATIAPGIAADGGRSAGLVAAAGTAAASWVSGQWGTVTLEGPSREMVAVPSTALILDHGTWWVLVHTSRGNVPQRVVPGKTEGWQTWIASGLQPGQQVVTRDAFLEYHRGIAQSYQPPD